VQSQTGALTLWGTNFLQSNLLLLPLIAAYGADIPARQLITIDGQVMAVAFMANAQHLVYRADVLEQIGMDVPTSYEEVLAAAEKIRDMGIMENPVGGAYAAGWNLAEEFVNMYLGTGGELRRL